MDQIKIGNFMKELRKEKNLTQEQLADKLFVSRRTVSRWETGNNMPDMEVLIELADLYEVDLRELLNGERKTQVMNQEIKETAILAAEYTNTNAEKLKKFYHYFFIFILISGIISIVIDFMDLSGSVWEFLKGFGIGTTLGGSALGVFVTSQLFDKLSSKEKPCMFK